MAKIRLAIQQDIETIAHIERQCFAAAEAAPLTAFLERFSIFPECFWVLELDGQVIGHINGSINDQPELPDALYADASLHCPDGKYQTVFGLAVLPDFQGLGYACRLLKHFIDVSRQREHLGMVLTCKAHMISFYQKYGFVDLGVSDSSHGGERWNKMLLTY